LACWHDMATSCTYRTRLQAKNFDMLNNNRVLIPVFLNIVQWYACIGTKRENRSSQLVKKIGM